MIMHNRQQLFIDQSASLNYGVWISGEHFWDGASPDVSTVSIPGRNGDLIYSNNRFKNVTITYPCCIKEGFSQNFYAFRNMLYSNLGYRRIEDTHDPSVYRMGRITGALSPSDIVWNNDAGLFKVTFDCKPQRFLKSGEQAISVSNGTVLYNGTGFNSKPLIRVYGSGTLNIGDYTLTVASNGLSYIDIDCEIMEAYYESTNANGYISSENDYFPEIVPGENEVTFSGFTQVKITPRWWIL